MSTLDEKLERQVTHEGRAMRRLSTLTESRGFRVEEGPAKRPTVVSHAPGPFRSWWRRVEGDAEAGNPMFEWMREEVETPTAKK